QEPQVGEAAPTPRLRDRRLDLPRVLLPDPAPGAEPQPAAGSALAAALIESFGSVDQWHGDFQAIGDMRGIGWVILFEDPVTDRLTNHWVSLHQEGIVAGFKPLLVMDVWEHEFMRDYKATEKAKYVEAFFRNVDWAMVQRRLQEAQAIRPAAAA